MTAESSWHNSIVAIHEAGGRAAEVTRQLLAFGRKQLLQPKVLAVNQAIHSVEGLLRRLLPEHIRVSLDLSPAVQPIFADPRHPSLRRKRWARGPGRGTTFTIRWPCADHTAPPTEAEARNGQEALTLATGTTGTRARQAVLRSRTADHCPPDPG